MSLFRWLALLATLLIGVAWAQTAAPAGPQLTPAQEAQVQRVAAGLRCPVCQALPITESGTEISHRMLADVRRLVQSGQSDTEVRDYFARRFGEGVLLDPPKRGANLLLWGLPLLALLAGGWWWSRFLRARPAAPAPADPALLDRVERAVRERREGGT